MVFIKTNIKIYSSLVLFLIVLFVGYQTLTIFKIYNAVKVSDYKQLEPYINDPGIFAFKKTLALESIIKTNKKEGIEFIEKTLKNTDGETERIIWEKLKYYKVKLPSGLNILNEKSFSNKESIKNYYFSIMPENEIVDKIKELVIKNKEDYTKDAIFIDNCGEIINSLSSNKEDMKVNEKLIKLIIYYSNSLNDASNEVSRVESNLSGLRNNINENFRNIHITIMADYAVKNLPLYPYMDENMKYLYDYSYNQTNELLKATVENLSNGDEEKKLLIYMSIIKDNGLFNKLSQTIAKASENIKNKKNIEAGINEKINNRNKLKSKLDILKEILLANMSKKNENGRLENKDLILANMSLGLNIEEVRALYREKEISTEEFMWQNAKFVIYNYKDVSFCALKNDGANNGDLWSIEIFTPKYSTYRDIRVGDSPDLIIERYGQPASKTDSIRDGIKYTNYCYSQNSARELTFAINKETNKIDKIYVDSWAL